MVTSKVTAFTLGNPEAYEAALDQMNIKGKPLYKVGRHEGYGGGCVFHTKEEAEQYAIETQSGFIPYGLILPNGWDEDVEEGEHFGFLLHDAEVVRL